MHKKSCEQIGKYGEAESTKKRLWNFRKKADFDEKNALFTCYVTFFLFRSIRK